ncbi:MAG: ABC transporter permease [Muribaculaceae bacterium]|nr:ABC transporter permease [Muribaculaceae bacterium]MDE7080729.1 ABC transporter permease [Muribaculaceae bacterium]
MRFSNLIKIALRALNNNKLRCFLTMLGIIIGVGSVITMLAIGQGSKNSIKAQIAEMGSNMIMIHPGSGQRGGVRQSADDMQTLKVEDYETIRDNTKYVTAVSPQVSSSGQFINGNNNYPSQLQGITPDYLDIRQLKVKEGEMFTDHDIATAAKVCVLGQTVVDNLFPSGEDPVGKVVRFNKIPLTVVGVLEEKGTNSMGQDQDDVVLAPYTTVMKRVLAIDYIQGLFASAIDENLSQEASDEITALLRTNHKLKDGTDDDFNIRTQQELSEMMSSTSEMMTVLLGCVAGISLLVGGIGIMNIMYVSVTERTREIGLRMAIGAKGRDILAQFLIESVIISITGGVIGVLLGGLAAWMVNLFAHWPVQIQLSAVVLSFTVCTVTGVFFGWYPAQKAANLNPIDALRYE